MLVERRSAAESEGESEHTVLALDVERDIIWSEYEKKSNFFESVRLAQDGGFSKVPGLWARKRWVLAIMAIAVLAMNVKTVLSNNFSILSDTWTTNQPSPQFLISTSVMRLPCAHNGTLALLNKDIYVCDNQLKPEVLMAVLELGMGLYLLFRAARSMRHVCCAKSHAYRWHAVSSLFWNSMPELSTFSALRMLKHITPSVLIPRLSAKIASDKASGTSMCNCKFIHFIVWRMCCAVIGVDAFLMKLREVALRIGNTEATGLEEIIPALAFLNQMLGIINVGIFVRRRIFVFIFGGEDGVMNRDEKATLQTWEAMLAQRIWQHFNCARFVAVMLTYSDNDFQKLVLEDTGKGWKCPETTRKMLGQVELGSKSSDTA